ncbi:hypothetical protein VKT23_017902 [Stygiomarasmius scandens]|uniref:Uncharacterized protein n=1 Tax=Marasmiellus scandens TaxID=2682957 RepID=A0ABR1ITF8_9AGAR
MLTGAAFFVLLPFAIIGVVGLTNGFITVQDLKATWSQFVEDSHRSCIAQIAYTTIEDLKYLVAYHFEAILKFHDCLIVCLGEAAGYTVLGFLSGFIAACLFFTSLFAFFSAIVD